LKEILEEYEWIRKNVLFMYWYSFKFHSRRKFQLLG
jgi:hypothetical protein